MFSNNYIKEWAQIVTESDDTTSTKSASRPHSKTIADKSSRRRATTVTAAAKKVSDKKNVAKKPVVRNDGGISDFTTRFIDTGIVSGQKLTYNIKNNMPSVGSMTAFSKLDGSLWETAKSNGVNLASLTNAIRDGFLCGFYFKLNATPSYTYWFVFQPKDQLAAIGDKSGTNIEPWRFLRTTSAIDDIESLIFPPDDFMTAWGPPWITDVDKFYKKTNFNILEFVESEFFKTCTEMFKRRLVDVLGGDELKKAAEECNQKAAEARMGNDAENRKYDDKYIHDTYVVNYKALYNALSRFVNYIQDGTRIHGRNWVELQKFLDQQRSHSLPHVYDGMGGGIH